MKIAVEYNNRRLSGFEYLLCQCPPSEFDSPYRSAVPMLCFCRDPEAALTRVTRTLGLDPPRQLTLSFAYGLVVGKGRGRPARTDLLLIADQYAVAIEASTRNQRMNRSSSGWKHQLATGRSWPAGLS